MCIYIYIHTHLYTYIYLYTYTYKIVYIYVKSFRFLNYVKKNPNQTRNKQKNPDHLTFEKIRLKNLGTQKLFCTECHPHFFPSCHPTHKESSLIFLHCFFFFFFNFPSPSSFKIPLLQPLNV